jgi:prepilin-type N-terminal cleavage/methylation domain-containing protein
VRRHGDDAGVTLMELVVAMTIASIFGVILTGAIVQTYHVTNSADADASAQSQLNIAFLRLDTEIRYAAGISAPGRDTGGDPYVEYLTTNTGADICGELRLNGAAAQLQWRRWPRGDAPGGWTVLASEVSSATPFTFGAPGTGAAYQTLTLSLDSGVGPHAKQFRTTFTALNSTPSEHTEEYCVEGRPAL